MPRKYSKQLYPMVIFGVVVAICALAVFFYPPLLITLLNYSDLFIVAAIFIIVTRVGRSTINLKSESKPTLIGWLLKLYGLQVITMAAFISQLFPFYQYNIITRHTPTALEQSQLKQTLDTFFSYQNIFIWALVLVFCCCFYLLSKRFPNSKSALTEFTQHNFITQQILAPLHISFRFGALFIAVISITLFAISLNIMVFHQNAASLNTFIGSVAAFVLILLASSKRISNWFKRINSKSPQALALNYLLIFIVCFIFLCGFSFAVIHINSLFPNISKGSFKIEPLHIKANHWFYSLWMLVWWICMTPLLGSIITHLSQQRSLRSVILFGLVLPIVLAVLFTQTNLLQQIIAIFSAKPATALIIQALFAVIIVLFCYHRHGPASLWRGYYNRFQLKKSRFNLAANWLMAAVIIGLFALGGISILLIIISTVVLVSLIYLTTMLHALTK